MVDLLVFRTSSLRYASASQNQAGCVKKIRQEGQEDSDDDTERMARPFRFAREIERYARFRDGAAFNSLK
jgi:hypothetical protein